MRTIPLHFHVIWFNFANPAIDQVPPAHVQQIYNKWQQHHADAVTTVWNDSMANAFVRERFTVDICAWYFKLARPVMRVDVFKIMLMIMVGGIYVDCDLLCFGSLKTIIHQRSLVLANSNWFMAARPQHPFMWYLLHDIGQRQANCLLNTEQAWFVRMHLLTGPWQLRAAYRFCLRQPRYRMKESDGAHMLGSDEIKHVMSHTATATWLRNFRGLAQELTLLLWLLLSIGLALVLCRRIYVAATRTAATTKPGHNSVSKIVA